MDDEQPIDLCPPHAFDPMARTTAQLCTLKTDLDRYGRRAIGQAFLDDWMAQPMGGTCAYHGHSFLWLILPFMGWEPDVLGAPYKAYVNPGHVLGASIKGLPEHVPETEVASRIAYYSTTFDSQDYVHYIRYPALGLYWAHEGKHRIAFMCAHEQPSVAAWVSDAQYPAPERLVLIAPTDERDEWLVLLDDRYLQVLWRPRVSRQLLDAYGVKTVRWRDKFELPEERSVRDAIYARRLHRKSATTAERDRTLDLDELRREMQLDNASVERTIQELAPLQFDRRRYAGIIAICLLVGVTLVVAPIDMLRPAGWALSGGACGLAAALQLFRLRGPRRVILLRSHR